MKDETKKGEELNLGNTGAGSGTQAPGNMGSGAANTGPATKPPKQEKETVEISREDLAKLMEKLDRQAKDIDILYRSSDKSRLAKAIGDGGEILIKKVNVWTWDNTGKVVMATELKTNRCEVVLGKWYEDQSVAVVLEDGEALTVPYIEFARKILNKVPAEIIGTTKKTGKNNKEDIIFKLQFPNGKVLEINSAFVN